MRKAIGLFVLFLTVSPCFAATSTSHNGLWWLPLTDVFTTGYAIGFIEGIAQASSMWDYLNRKGSGQHIEPKDAEVAKNLANFGNLHAGQLVDGLNVFYGDFRNQNIHVEDAIGFVRDQIKGMSESLLATELQHLREEASSPGYDK